VAALGRLKNKSALDPLLAAYRDPLTRDQAITALAQTPDVRALDAYLDGLTQSDLKIRESARQALRAIRKEAQLILKGRASSPELAKELRLIFGSEVSASPDDYLRHGLAEKGDPANGKKLFASSCVQCHAVGSEGAKVGPDLTTVGAQFSRREIAESILFPSKAVREGYQSMNIETKDGDFFSGLLKAETVEEVTLVDSAAQLQRIPKSQIVSRKLSELSLMPEGLHSGLTLSEFADLLAYLESLR
jgi:putative heme-binding domain-containing protein